MDSVPTEIICVECGGPAHCMSFPPPEGFSPGDIVAYVCEDCGQRHDVEIEAGDAPAGE